MRSFSLFRPACASTVPIRTLVHRCHFTLHQFRRYGSVESARQGSICASPLHSYNYKIYNNNIDNKFCLQSLPAHHR